MPGGERVLVERVAAHHLRAPCASSLRRRVVGARERDDLVAALDAARGSSAPPRNPLPPVRKTRVIEALATASVGEAR